MAFPNRADGLGYFLDTANQAAIGRACHEANRAWCEFNGDLSQKPWEEAEEWQRQSAIDGIMFIFEFPEAGDSAMHDNWSKTRIADGWVYGEVKDADAKTHPCLVPFTFLPPHQQFKDKLFRAVALAGLSELPLVPYTYEGGE